MALNSYTVPKKQWKKWSEQAQNVFNDVYGTIAYNPLLITHPEQPVIDLEHWQTIAWNSAWLAADAAQEYKND